MILIYKNGESKILEFREIEQEPIEITKELHIVNTTCTHMGCELNWNSAESSWDCPCHGSRFSYEGEILEGPAIKAL